MKLQLHRICIFSVAIVIGAYPALSIIVDSAGSTLWYLLGTAGLLALAIFTKRTIEARNGCEVNILGFILIAFLLFSFLNQAVHGLDDFSTSRLERQALLLLTIPIFYLIAALKIEQKTLFRAFSISGFLFFIYFLISSHETRLNGVVHAIHFGNIAMVTMLLCMPAIAISRSAIWRTVSIVAFTGSLLAFVYSGSRGGIVALTLTLVFALFFWSMRHKLFSQFAITIAIISIILFVSVQNIDPLKKRYTATLTELQATEKGQFDNSIGIRLQLWKQALLSAQENYITGSGYSAYRQQVLGEVSNGTLSSLYVGFSSEPHNQILFQFSATGAVGLALMFFLFFAPIVLILKKSRLQPNIFEVCIILSIISLFFCGFTITLLDQRRVIQIFGFLYILAALSLKTRACGSQPIVPEQLPSPI